MSKPAQTPFSNSPAPNLKRYREIISVLARHGFGSFLADVQLEHRISLPSRLLKQADNSNISPAEHLRLALEELGPTFVKLGQILSTRPDILPPDFIKELSKLKDSVPPKPWEDMHAVLVDEMGGEPEQFFEQIDPVPLGAASLAQVHAATLKSGEEVVIKVQRPDILATIESDLAILKEMASIAERTPWGVLNHPEEMVDEFAYSLHNELDYRREGRNADRFRANFEGSEYLHIPKIYWEHTTRRILVMERMQGIKIDDIAALDAAGYDRKMVALHAADMIIKEVLQDGFFHADPHAGNYIIMPGELIGVMDFGLVGELTKRDRTHLTQLYVDVIALDADSIIDELIRMEVVHSGTDRSRLRRDLERLLGKYTGAMLKDIHIQEILEEITALCSRHRLSIPPNLWLLGKSLAMIEGLGLQLDPDFDFFAVSEPYMGELKRQVWLPKAEWGQTLLRQGADWVEFLKLLPRTGRRLLEKTEQDELFEFGLKDKDILLGGLSRLVNRLSLSIVIAGLVVSLAILITVTATGSPVQVLIVAGFIATLGLSIWLLISILRGIT
jgi:ubiquinone biosynthesis protein